MTISKPLDPYSEVVDANRRWVPDWYEWLRELVETVTGITGDSGGGTTTTPPAVTISDVAPASPRAGMLWWENDSGTLWLYYDDGNSAQWIAINSPVISPVVITPPPPSGDDEMPIPGSLSGLTLSYTSATPTVLGIGLGGACSDDGTTTMIMTNPFTKIFSTNFAPGTGLGAYDGGAAFSTSTWYHVFLIFNPTTNAVDVLVSKSASTPVMPSGFTKRRRIGSVKSNSSGNMTGFTQDGDYFQVFEQTTWEILNAGLAAHPTYAPLTINTPLGVRVIALITVANLNAGTWIVVKSLDAATVGFPNTSLISSGSHFSDLQIQTNALSQITAACSSAVPSGFYLVVKGWIDSRGK